MVGESSYVEHAPTPALAAFAWSVWIQQVGDRPLAQRHEPHGGAEVRCVLGEAPRLLGPLTASTYLEIPAGGTVVGMRLRPGALGGLVGMPAHGVGERCGLDRHYQRRSDQRRFLRAAQPRHVVDRQLPRAQPRAGVRDTRVRISHGA